MSPVIILILLILAYCIIGVIKPWRLPLENRWAFLVLLFLPIFVLSLVLILRSDANAFAWMVIGWEKIDGFASHSFLDSLIAYGGFTIGLVALFYAPYALLKGIDSDRDGEPPYPQVSMLAHPIVILLSGLIETFSPTTRYSHPHIKPIKKTEGGDTVRVRWGFALFYLALLGLIAFFLFKS